MEERRRKEREGKRGKEEWREEESRWGGRKREGKGEGNQTSSIPWAGGSMADAMACCASLTFFMASSTSLFCSWAVGPCGFTIAFLLWFTLSVCVLLSRVGEKGKKSKGTAPDEDKELIWYGKPVFQS